MNVILISKLILSSSIIAAILILIFSKESLKKLPINNNDIKDIKGPVPKKETGSKFNKSIPNWSGSVPSSSYDTTLNPIVMYSNYNTINQGDNKTLIPLGTYKSAIPIKSDLVISSDNNNHYDFKTTKNGEHYLTYSKNGDKKTDLKPGQIYWTKNKNKLTKLYKNDKNILFRVDSDGNVTNDQLYFKWYGTPNQERNFDSGYFLFKNKNNQDNDPNLVTYIFQQKL